MNIQISNQKPALLYFASKVLPNIPVITDESTYNSDRRDAISKMMVEPIFESIVPNVPVDIIDNTDPKNPLPITSDMISDAINSLWIDDTLDVDTDAQLNEIYRQSLQYGQSSDWLIDEQLVAEALARQKLPLPGTNNGVIVQYTETTDIIPTAKQLLAKTTSTLSDSDKELWFGTIGAYLHQNQNRNILPITVTSSAAFDHLKAEIKTALSMVSPHLTLDTNKMFNDLDAISIKGMLSSTFMLPSDNEAYSFSRTLMSMLASFEASFPNELFIQPINISQLFNPENIVILNLEEYSHATARQIKNDWDKINQAINISQRWNMVSNKKLTTAKAINQATTKTQGPHIRNKKGGQVHRVKTRHFSGTPITSGQMLQAIIRVIQYTTTTRKTQNMYKVKKPTFMRANRRDPNNINAMGKFNTNKYRPDIHIYIDTSGSISEAQYRDAVMNIILLSKRISANLFITSFADYVTQTYQLQTKGLSVQQIYANFMRIPKTTGGTNFENVWSKIDAIDKINTKAGKSYQLNFMITDFEYSLSRNRRFSPQQASVKNTYYLPISTSKAHWQYLVDAATSFSKEMMAAGDKTIRQRMLL